MVIGHNHRHAKFFCQLDLFQRRNAVVTGDNGVDAVFLRLLDDGFVDPVPVADALRNLVIDLPAAPGQSPVQKIGRTHPVDIVLTHNADADPLPDLFQDQSSRLVHIFHLVGIVKLVQSSV